MPAMVRRCGQRVGQLRMIQRASMESQEAQSVSIWSSWYRHRAQLFLSGTMSAFSHNCGSLFSLSIRASTSASTVQKTCFPPVKNGKAFKSEVVDLDLPCSAPFLFLDRPHVFWIRSVLSFPQLGIAWVRHQDSCRKSQASTVRLVYGTVHIAQIRMVIASMSI